MQRLSDDTFKFMKYNADNIIGIRIKDGEFYFLAWMENAQHYRIQQAMNSNGYLLSRDIIISSGDLYTAITECDGYDNMYLLYERDDNGNLIHEEDKKFKDEYDKFLSLIRCYERNGQSDEDDHDIIMITKEEMISFFDVFRDGDYVFIITDM